MSRASNFDVRDKSGLVFLFLLIMACLNVTSVQDSSLRRILRELIEVTSLHLSLRELVVRSTITVR
jgi:hypothetical protein